jgi:hypothetical protein
MTNHRIQRTLVPALMTVTLRIFTYYTPSRWSMTEPVLDKQATGTETN